jgi:hypothetical protein
MRSTAPVSLLVSVLIIHCQAFQVDDRSVLHPAKKAGRSINDHSTLRSASVVPNDDNSQPRPNGVPVFSKESPRLGYDSVERFSNDLRKVLKELRPSDEDPEVPGGSFA